MAHRGLPLDFRGLPKVGSMLGSAGVVVLNDTVDLAEAAMWQSVFFEDESCGQCAPCRLGTQFVRQAVGRYRDSGDPTHLDHLDDVAWEMEEWQHLQAGHGGRAARADRASTLPGSLRGAGGLRVDRARHPARGAR